MINDNNDNIYKKNTHTHKTDERKYIYSIILFTKYAQATNTNGDINFNMTFGKIILCEIEQ